MQPLHNCFGAMDREVIVHKRYRIHQGPKRKNFVCQEFDVFLGVDFRVDAADGGSVPVRLAESGHDSADQSDRIMDAVCSLRLKNVDFTIGTKSKCIYKKTKS